MRPAFHRTSKTAAVAVSVKQEVRMKAFQSLTAIMLLGALSVGPSVAVGKGRNHASDADSRAMKSSDGGQKSGGDRFGAAKSPTTIPGNSAGADLNVLGRVNAGTTKQGNGQRGETSPQNLGASKPGKNQPDLNAARQGSVDVGPGTPVIADGPGHKTNRPADTTKKIATIVRPHGVRQPRRPTGLGAIERNSVGALIRPDASRKLSERNSIGTVIHHDPRPKSGLDSKITARVNSVPASSIPTPAVRLGHNLANPRQHGPIINGNSVRLSGSKVTSIGGPTKNIALNGNNFRPRYP
jgi:hypothetical protein